MGNYCCRKKSRNINTNLETEVKGIRLSQASIVASVGINKTDHTNKDEPLLLATGGSELVRIKVSAGEVSDRDSRVNTTRNELNTSEVIYVNDKVKSRENEDEEFNMDEGRNSYNDGGKLGHISIDDGSSGGVDDEKFQVNVSLEAQGGIGFSSGIGFEESKPGVGLGFEIGIGSVSNNNVGVIGSSSGNRESKPTGGFGFGFGFGSSNNNFEANIGGRIVESKQDVGIGFGFGSVSNSTELFEKPKPSVGSVEINVGFGANFTQGYGEDDTYKDEQNDEEYGASGGVGFEIKTAKTGHIQAGADIELNNEAPSNEGEFTVGFEIGQVQAGADFEINTDPPISVGFETGQVQAGADFEIDTEPPSNSNEGKFSSGFGFGVEVNEAPSNSNAGNFSSGFGFGVEFTEAPSNSNEGKYSSGFGFGVETTETPSNEGKYSSGFGFGVEASEAGYLQAGADFEINTEPPSNEVKYSSGYGFGVEGTDIELNAEISTETNTKLETLTETETEIETAVPTISPPIKQRPSLISLPRKTPGCTTKILKLNQLKLLKLVVSFISRFKIYYEENKEEIEGRNSGQISERTRLNELRERVRSGMVTYDDNDAGADDN